MAGRPRKIKPENQAEVQAEEKKEQKSAEHEELEVCAVRSKVTGCDFVKSADGEMVFLGKEELKLTKKGWAEFMWEIGQAARQLKI